MADLTLDLDIAEVQIVVVVNYPADTGDFFNSITGFFFIALRGVWLTLTPDLELQRHDLNAQRHRVLNRAAPYPGDVAAEIYAHDPIGTAALAGYKRQAQIQAAILGEGSLEDAEVFQWVIAEVGHADFGAVIDAGLFGNEATGLAFSGKGLVLRAGEEVFVERVMARDLADWRRTRGRETADVRLLGDHKDASGKRRLDLKSAVVLMKNVEDKEFPITGVRAAKESHEAVASSSGEFLSYHAEWLRLSGVNKKASAVHIHRALYTSAVQTQSSSDEGAPDGKGNRRKRKKNKDGKGTDTGAGGSGAGGNKYFLE